MLAEDDPSLSRHHATLIIMTVPTTEIDGSELVKALHAKQTKYKDATTAKSYGGRGFSVLNPNADQEDDEESGVPSYPVPEIILLDTSKHGCFVNNQRVNPITRKATITRSDVIRFGAHTTGRLTYFPVIATLSPSLTDNEVRDAVRILAKFGCFINNPKKSNAVPMDAYQRDQILNPQQRALDAAVKARRLMRSESNNNSLAMSHSFAGNSFASGVFISEVTNLLTIGAEQGDMDSEHGFGGAGGRRGTEELDLYGFEGQRNTLRSRPLEDVSHHMSPADATALHLTPMMFVLVTNEIELGDPSAMLAMMHQYRLVDNNYLYTLFEAVFNTPTLAPSRWPEPRQIEHPSLVDCPYYKPPLLHIEHQHFHTFAVQSTFRMVHFGFLQDNLYPRYEPVITKGGGKATQIDPAKVIERLSNLKLFCNTSSVGETVLGDDLSGAGSGEFGSGVYDTASLRSGGTNNASSVFSSHGRRKGRSRRTKRIPQCLKLMGIVEDDTDSHGANLRIVVSSSVFQYLAREMKEKYGSGPQSTNYLHKGADEEDELLERNSLGSDAQPLPNVNPEVLDAAIHLFDSGYYIVHEDNIHSAIYCHDTASQILPNSPGVLARSEIVVKEAETDSDATVCEDSDDDAAERAAGIGLTQYDDGGYSSVSSPLRHEQLVKDPVLHSLHYAHLHREVKPLSAVQVPVAAIRVRTQEGFAARADDVVAGINDQRLTRRPKRN